MHKYVIEQEACDYIVYRRSVHAAEALKATNAIIEEAAMKLVGEVKPRKGQQHKQRHLQRVVLR